LTDFCSLRFQSDHDYALIEELNKRAGLLQLEKAIKGPHYIAPPSESSMEAIIMSTIGRATFMGRTASARAMSQGGDLRAHYSVYAPFCSDVKVVHEHLNSGTLVEMLVEKEWKMLLDEKAASFDSAGPGYEFVFLGACAMSLSCTIPEHYKTAMRKVFMCVGLMQDAVTQMDEALNSAKPYVDGEPWDFGSLDLKDTMMRRDVIGGPTNDFGMLGCNTEGPGTMLYNPPKGPTDGLKELKFRFKEGRYGTEACGACGAEQGKDGTALLQCSGCHTRKYCSKECQKAHWKSTHKKLCKELSKAKQENLEPETGVTEHTSEDAVAQGLMEATIDDLD
jgi:hypothetical protein